VVITREGNVYPSLAVVCPLAQARRWTMERDFLRSFFRFLEEATLEELRDRRDKLRSVRKHLREPGVKADRRFLARRIDEELQARWELRQVALR